MKLWIVDRPSAQVTFAKRRRSTILPTVALAILFALSLRAAAQQETRGGTKNNGSDYTELAKAPQKASERPNPLEKDPDAVAAGAKLFEMHCAECHGATADGGKKAPSLRSQEVQQATPGTLFWLLTNGVVRRGMPVWSKLPEPQRWQIVSYIKSLSPPAASPQGASGSQDKTSPIP